MKRLLILILSAVVIISCSKKDKHEEESGDWKELDSLHKVMAKAYHPLKDSGDLQPTKELINQLADEAEKCSDGTLPEKVNTPEVKDKLKKLKTDAKALANDIRNGATDDIIKDKMIVLHDLFHEVMVAWHHNDDDEEEEGEDEHEHQ